MLKLGDVVVAKDDNYGTLRFVKIVTNADSPNFNEGVELIFDVNPYGHRYLVGTTSSCAFTEDDVIVLGNVNQAVVSEQKA